MAKSKKVRRQDRILEILQRNPTIRVNMLARDLDVSAETVRRDLAELNEIGQIQRTYGGAVRAAAFEPALAERLNLFVPERERIAHHATTLLGDARSIFIGGGATTLHFARALRLVEHQLTVLTPSLGIASELAPNRQIEVMLLPGIVDPSEGLVSGAETIAFVRKFCTPIAIIGASALDTTGISEALLSPAHVYSSMIASADKTLILADASKFNSRSLQLVAEWSSNITLVTDKTPDPPILASIKRNGAGLVIAPD